ncbi:ABC transporter permease [Vallitalea guaymasensis]|uniref:ABC transporter permease n=1 Tax=Vallitalea guaymasensis TaxID=1185412 RepID=UPI000DE1D749|nr:ABC transporter permease subunit [Vallitalea guaymasensis]
MNTASFNSKKNKVKTSKKINISTLQLVLLCIPGLLCFFIFNYIPMFGVIFAFKDYRYDLGLWKSEWVGMDNFKFFFSSNDAFRVTRNTLLYNFTFIILVIAGSLFIAILLNEITKKKWIKLYQTIYFFPHFLSWPVVAFMTYALFQYDYGILNQILEFFGLDPQLWYMTPKAWPIIMPLANLWKTIGYNTILFYAALIGIDTAYYEAAAIDGANRIKMAIHITIPLLKPVTIILLITKLGKIFYSDFGQFYMLPKNSGMLYSVVDVIDTYVYRGLSVTGDIGMSSAVGLYQSIVGLIIVLTANYVIKKISPDDAMF